MTFLEKLKEDQPTSNIPDDAKGIGCPKEYGYEKGQFICLGSGSDCTKCWNREMPNTEARPLEKASKQVLEAHDIGYNKGLNDAWMLATKICDDMGIHERENAFGYKYETDVMKCITPQKAIAMLKAYEEAQKIEVGDVVVWADFADDVFNGVVLDFKDSTDNEVVVFDENGCVEVWKIADCKKTGKHIDIQSILEQIG